MSAASDSEPLERLPPGGSEQRARFERRRYIHRLLSMAAHPIAHPDDSEYASQVPVMRSQLPLVYRSVRDREERSLVHDHAHQHATRRAGGGRPPLRPLLDRGKPRPISALRSRSMGNLATVDIRPRDVSEQLPYVAHQRFPHHGLHLTYRPHHHNMHPNAPRADGQHQQRSRSEMGRKVVRFPGDPPQVPGAGGMDNHYEDQSDHGDDRDQGDDRDHGDSGDNGDARDGEDDEDGGDVGDGGDSEGGEISTDHADLEREAGHDDALDEVHPGDGNGAHGDARGPFSHAAADRRRRAGGRWTAPLSHRPAAVLPGSRSPVGKLASLNVAHDSVGEDQFGRGLAGSRAVGAPAGSHAAASSHTAAGSTAAAGSHATAVSCSYAAAGLEAAWTNTDVSLCLSTTADESPVVSHLASAAPRAFYSEPPRRWRDGADDAVHAAGDDQPLDQSVLDSPTAPQRSTQRPSLQSIQSNPSEPRRRDSTTVLDLGAECGPLRPLQSQSLTSLAHAPMPTIFGGQFRRTMPARSQRGGTSFDEFAEIDLNVSNKLVDLFNSIKKASALGPAANTSNTTSNGSEFIGFVEALALHIRDWTQRRRAPRGSKDTQADSEPESKHPTKCKSCSCVRTGGGYVLVGYGDTNDNCVECHRPLDYNLNSTPPAALFAFHEIIAREQPPKPANGPPGPVRRPSLQAIVPPPKAKDPPRAAAPAPVPAPAPPQPASPAPLPKSKAKAAPAPIPPLPAARRPSPPPVSPASVRPPPLSLPATVVKQPSTEKLEPPVIDVLAGVATPQDSPRDADGAHCSDEACPVHGTPRQGSLDSASNTQSLRRCSSMVNVMAEQAQDQTEEPPAAESSSSTAPAPRASLSVPPPSAVVTRRRSEPAPAAQPVPEPEPATLPKPPKHVPKPTPAKERPPAAPVSDEPPPPAASPDPPAAMPEPAEGPPTIAVDAVPSAPPEGTDALNESVEVPVSARRRAGKKMPTKMNASKQPSGAAVNPSGIIDAGFDVEPMQYDAFDYLAQFCIISNDKAREYARAFRAVAQVCSSSLGEATLTVDQLTQGLKLVNHNLITDEETQYIFSVLDLFAWSGGERRLVRDVDLHMFSVVAALSERVVALEPWVRRCIADLDAAALQHKLGRAKALFYCNDPDCTGRILLDDLRVELKAGGVSAAHEDNVIARLQKEGRDSLPFIDYLAHIPLFVMIHDCITFNPFDENRTR